MDAPSAILIPIRSLPEDIFVSRSHQVTPSLRCHRGTKPTQRQSIVLLFGGKASINTGLEESGGGRAKKPKICCKIEKLENSPADLKS